MLTIFCGPGIIEKKYGAVVMNRDQYYHKQYVFISVFDSQGVAGRTVGIVLSAWMDG